MDTLVNKAGINLKDSALGRNRATFERVINVNLIGAFLFYQTAKVTRSQEGGRIINISSIAGLTRWGGK